ncbi:Asp-tRNA(Asn)/Glu-tRNA(Gln) amidotransferase subunit GatB [Candidatus Parcubacteria bacterium]|nr:Asp-tRNA(Asn)/Glu-tRNA(Gln) amidotransferase subunit GatB [Candidatus Parcubacteria bacterium]
MKDYKLTVGLEVHAELKTETKMFCNSKNDTNETRPNINICPVCMGYPGTLPVINKEAIKNVLRFGVAVGGEIADYTEFDRKNYFYPDIPKGYQISQYKHPLVSGGELAGVKLTRVHLEEDTARSLHNSQSPISNLQSISNDQFPKDGETLKIAKLKNENSLVDFNRAGVPLMELVTEPVIHTALEAGNFARELQLLLKYLDISEANMEKGEMRVEANISVSKDGTLGTKVEVKNINSFKAVEKAIAFEALRHIELLEKGESVVQETRGWNENKEETFSQRLKEESHDYRYFPDPDLPKLLISEIPEFGIEKLKSSLPILPSEKRESYKNSFGLKDADIEIYVKDLMWGDYFESVAKLLDNKDLYQLASNYITSDLKSTIPPEHFVEVVKMIDSGEISSRGAKDLLKTLQEEGGEPKKIAEERDLLQKSNVDELKIIVKEIIDTNKVAVEEYKNGKIASLQFLVGQGMKATKGSGNPQVLKSLFEELLK